ncbi:RraA family protein [Bradyrhizobium sp. WYCCWR 13023]|uniref:Putative 4-hydroxy-4-methyl-2-oxoglutarate aldolase n=1 Tax=Bradyrhizobium zhengyangense TaxID=2911009 RepID=A0A9X1RG58_9BRAD|nr:RraA family protein [Bradyrhizobium zhengyangense]MCG2630965.1 RraA family protein [Bradyrhizobium zhengyangense]MCG2671301.1 RraA family protein [Bradyrhizobium zhengyangense]
MPVGFRILKRNRKIGADVVERFARLPVANVSDSMSRLTAGGARLRPMHGSGGLAGAALTVKTAPGDNLMVHKAIALAEPGDVIVVDAGGDLTNAITGEMMMMQMVKRGVAGLVINGAIRDAGFIRSQTFPVFAAGVTHRGPYKNGPGEINVAIAIDGMVIEPGDLIIGDDDGLLCVPFDQTEAVFKAATAKFEAEQKQMANIEAGTHDASWVDKQLRELKCEGVD